MKLQKHFIALALALTAMSANAAPGDLVCNRNFGHFTDRLVIDTQGHYTFEEKWNGSFPTHSEDAGATAGWQTVTETGISAQYTMTAFDLPSTLTVKNSIGEFVVGEDSPITNLTCAIEP